MGDGLPAGDCEGIRWCACLAGVSRLGVRCCADSSGPRASANGSRPELAEALKNWRWTEPLHTCTSLQLCLWLWLRTVSECQAWSTMDGETVGLAQATLASLICNRGRRSA